MSQEAKEASRPKRLRERILIAIGGALVLAWTTWFTGLVDAATDRLGISGPRIFPSQDVEVAPEQGEESIGADYTGGWGPSSRETFSIYEPAAYPVFNSITDNPQHGNELNFVQCKELGEPSTEYADDHVVRGPTRYVVYAYIANASTNPDMDITGARMWLLRGQEPAYITGVGVALDGHNVDAVWDGCTFHADERLEITYVPGSAVLYYGTEDDEMPLSDAAVRGEEYLPDTGDGLGVVPAVRTALGFLELEIIVQPAE